MLIIVSLFDPFWLVDSTVISLNQSFDSLSEILREIHIEEENGGDREIEGFVQSVEPNSYGILFLLLFITRNVLFGYVYALGLPSLGRCLHKLQKGSFSCDSTHVHCWECMSYDGLFELLVSSSTHMGRQHWTLCPQEAISLPLHSTLVFTFLLSWLL